MGVLLAILAMVGLYFIAKTLDEYLQGDMSHKFTIEWLTSDDGTRHERADGAKVYKDDNDPNKWRIQPPSWVDPDIPAAREITQSEYDNPAHAKRVTDSQWPTEARFHKDSRI